MQRTRPFGESTTATVEPTPVTAQPMATEKQISFINSLMSQVELTDEQRSGAETALEGGLTKKQASSWITRLLELKKDQPNKPALVDEKPETVQVTQAGVYEKDGEVFIVKPTRDKARLYAKRLVEINGERATESGDRVQIEFEYAAGVVYKLSPSDKMPLEKAKALTIRYGRCIVCGRHLKAAESVERGIGPVCIKSFA